MKILKVKAGQTVRIDNKVFITVKSIGTNTVRLGFVSDPHITITMVKNESDKHGNANS